MRQHPKDIGDRSSKRAKRAAQKVAKAAARSAEGEATPKNAILNAVALLVGYNLLAIFLGIPTGWWGSYERGWPVELMLIGLLLSAIMSTTGSIWLLIPAGIVLGNGFLFAFYSITNAWELWAWLWPLEPLLIGGVIYYTIRLAQEGERASQVARRIARAVWEPTIIVVAVVAVLGLIFGS